MKTLKTLSIPLFLVASVLAACAGFDPRPVTGPTSRSILLETRTSSPAGAFTDTPSSPPSPIPPTDISLHGSENIVYYYFVDPANEVPPEGSVVIMPDAYILAPSSSGLVPDPAVDANLRAALEFALADGRNGWTSSNLEIVELTFGGGHADVVLQGGYFGVGDVTLIAARMQILMTIFANASVQTAAVTLNGDTIGNLGVSNSMSAKPSGYVFTRAEVEAYIDEHLYGSP